MDRARAGRPWSWRASLASAAAVVVGLVGASLMVLPAAGASAATAPKTATVISTAKSGKLGTILVAGNTVYALKPSKTACDAKCLKAWPPVLLPDGVTSATAGPGVDATKLGTTVVGDGALQITYGGKPLYWFAKDTKPGQVKGNVTDKWGKWYTVATTKSGSGSSNSGSNSNAGTGGTAF